MKLFRRSFKVEKTGGDLNLRNYDNRSQLWLVLIDFFAIEFQKSAKYKKIKGAKQPQKKGFLKTKHSIVVVKFHELFVPQHFSKSTFLTKMMKIFWLLLKYLTPSKTPEHFFLSKKRHHEICSGFSSFANDW